MFANRSEDIHEIFRSTCEILGLSPTRMSTKAQSIARRHDVERLDQAIGPKS